MKGPIYCGIMAALLYAGSTCAASTISYEYDVNGYLSLKTDQRGTVTAYTNNTLGDILVRTDALGTPFERTRFTDWHPDYHLPVQITESGRIVTFGYDGRRLLLHRTIADTATAQSSTTQYKYTNDGKVSIIDGPRTDVIDITTYEYDALTNLTHITNALGHVNQITAHDTSGRPLTVVDPNGLVTQLRYDFRGRLLSTDRAGELTQLGYDPVGNLTSIISPDGTPFFMHYDTAHRLIAIEDSKSNRIDYSLDLIGNRTRTEVKDSSGQLSQVHSALFDELSRLLQSIGADNATTTYGYDAGGKRTSTTDALGHSSYQSFDALSRLITQLDPIGGTVSYGYDALDNLISVTDANGHTTHYDYDGLGNQIAQHSPDTGTTTFTHDAAGNLLTRTDAMGQVTRYQYDALNRLTRTVYADASDVVYEYDTSQNGIGRLAQLIDNSATLSWTYDTHGRTTARTQTILVDGLTHTLATAWQYNNAGQLVGMSYPSGMQVDYSYSSGKLSAVTVNGQPLLSAISYQPFGPISGWQWANGTQSWRGYNLDGQLIGQSLGSIERSLNYDVLGNLTAIEDATNTQSFNYDALSRLTAANDATFNLAWQYDANGNRISETNSGTLTPYSIDALSNRLLALAEQVRLYDGNGNLIDDGEHNYQYDVRERLTSVDEGLTGQYRYNALGQRVYKKGIALAGDLNGDGIVSKDDLKLVTGKVAQTIDCDGPGNGKAKGKGQQVACVATQIGNGTTNAQGNGNGVAGNTATGSRELLFAYNEHRLLGEYTLSDTTVQETVWLGDLPVATVQGEVIYAIHTDHLGTPRVITDTSNTEVWNWNSDPFGTIEANEDPDGNGAKLTYNLRFPGQYYDEETGKHYNYFRDYDPSTGRYIESDPIGLHGGFNTYAYVGNNPLRHTDFFGLSEDDDECHEVKHSFLGLVDVYVCEKDGKKRNKQKREKKQINDICKEYDIHDRNDFGDFLENEYKPDHGYKGGDTMAYDALRDAAKLYKGW